MKLLNTHGVTLVELMVALAITGIISAAMYSAYTSQQRINQAQDQIVEMQQNLRAGLDMMVREIRMAGYDPDETGNAGFTEATADSMAFTMVADDDGEDNDNDGATDEVGELKSVRYTLVDGYGDGDGVMDLCRQVGNDPNSRRVLIENVEAVEFYYTLLNGTQTLAPSTNDVTKNNIHSVQISVLARAPGISLQYTNDQTYTAGSGAVFEKDGGGPFNDNIRRRMQVITVYCRNMGW